MKKGIGSVKENSSGPLLKKDLDRPIPPPRQSLLKVVYLTLFCIHIKLL